MSKPKNYRHISKYSCSRCIHLVETKPILPPFKSYLCSIYLNTLSEAESYEYVCDSFEKEGKK